MIRRKLRTLEALLLMLFFVAAIRLLPVRYLLPAAKDSGGHGPPYKNSTLTPQGGGEITGVGRQPLADNKPDRRHGDAALQAHAGDNGARERALAIRGAIRSATARLPFKPSCLVQSLAAASMLRRRGLAHHLHIGARMDPDFQAHAWVEASGTIVAGEGDVGSYSVLLTRDR